MSSKRILGIAGAAMIGTLAGIGAAHAVINLGESGVTGIPVFAKETMLRSRNISPVDGSGGPYYEVAANTGASGELNVNIPAGIEVPATTTAVVTVELTNLVFSGLSLAGSTVITATTTADPPVVIANTTSALLSGGSRGDKRAQFSITTGANPITSTSRLVIAFGRFGADPTVDGSIKITISRTVAGERVASEVELSNVVKTASVLTTTATPQMQTASVEDGFMKFKAGTGVAADGLAAHVGNLRIGIATTTNTIYNAGRGGLSYNATGVITTASNIASAAKIVFTGPTSFLAEEGEGDDAKKRVYLGDEDCTPVGSSIVNDEGELEAALDDVSTATGTHLCLKVDGETAIPVTDPYEAAITYTSHLGSDTAFPLAPSNHTLGSIVRDGSTVRIAYLTTNQKYNQRLVLVNRSSEPVEYSMTFQTADGTTAEAKDAADGMLSAGRTVLDVRDIVTFDNGSGNGGHGSAELAVVVASSMIDVATVTTTRSDGSTDTVVMEAQ